MKEYWGVQRGNNQYRIPQNGESKTSKDIAEVVGVKLGHKVQAKGLSDIGDRKSNRQNGGLIKTVVLVVKDKMPSKKG